MPIDLSQFGLQNAGPSTGVFGGPVTTSSSPSPDDMPEVWDVVGLGTVGNFPPDPKLGRAVVDVEVSVKTDPKSPPGKNGATTTTQGLNPTPVTIKAIFHPKLWPAIKAQIQLMWPPKQPLDIVHEKTATYNITSISVDKIKGPDWDDYGRGTITLTCTGWQAPVAVSGSGAGGAGSSATTTPSSAASWTDGPAAQPNRGPPTQAEIDADTAKRQAAGNGQDVITDTGLPEGQKAIDQAAADASKPPAAATS